MDNTRTSVPPEPGPAQPKRIWAPPTVVDLGGLRSLTQLQGGSGGGICDPFEDPDCP